MSTNTTGKSQQMYEGTAILTVEDRHEGSGVLKKTSVVSLVHRAPIAAGSQKVADAKLVSMATEAAKGQKIDLDLDYVEFVCIPFASMFDEE